MSALADLQRSFVEALYSQAPCEPGIEAYRRNMQANLGNALAATYPVVNRLVGEAFFREAARQNVLANPSRSGDLNEYGAAFADFLAGYPHAKDLDYLADVARLEWACHESYHAADAAPFDASALASVPPEDYARLRFTLHPAVRLLASPHPVAEIWEANQPDRDGTLARGEGPDSVLVWRSGGIVRMRIAEPREWMFLLMLSEGKALGEAGAGDSVQHFLEAGLARLVGDGVIAGFALASPA